MAKVPAVYHSALTSGVEFECDPVPGPVHFTQGVAFQWNIMESPIPAFYRSCDVLYLEPPWPAGVKEFDKRAGVTTPSYSDLISRVESIILELGVPALMPCSKQAQRVLRTPDYLTTCILHGGPVDMAVWNGPEYDGVLNTDILDSLARRYECIGDFCCGYGLSGFRFWKAKKRFVLSDYNAKCIGYLATKAGWPLS